MESLQEAAVGETIVNTLKNHDGYVTINYLSEKTGSPLQTVQEYVILHPEKVRKSKIQTDSGDTLYTLNTPLSGLADAWQAFRFVNAKKF
jgi:predicted Zn-dependent protease